jgi:LysM repeat protein
VSVAPLLPNGPMSRSRLVTTIALAGLALAPLPMLAQGTSQTHTVRKGDTLWDLAQQYLGDAFRWPEIYRRNTATVADPNLIYPDQVLIISGDVAATPGTPADTAVAGVTPMAPAPGAEPTAMPAMPGMQEVAGPAPAMTIFNPDRFRVVRGQRETLVMRARPQAVRAGDYMRSPFMWDGAGMTGAGKVGPTVQVQAIATTRYARPVQLYERVYVTVPSNAPGAMNEEYIAFRNGPVLAGEGQVVIPTGVFRLVTAPQNGQAEAMLLSKYEDVYEGHGLIPSDPLQLPADANPARVEFGLRTSIVYMHLSPVVSSIGQHVILAAGASDGLVPGDQVTVQVEMGVDEKGVPRAPKEIAVLQVTRVTTWGASAILIEQTEGVVSAGMAARVSAKMP